MCRCVCVGMWECADMEECDSVQHLRIAYHIVRTLVFEGQTTHWQK